MKYDYDFFLFTQLAYAYEAIEIREAYDIVFGELITLYEDFKTSGYDDGYKNLYECYEDYFRNLNAQ
jgi:hypothetical protein